MDKTRAGSSPVDHTKGYAGWWNRSLKVGNTSYFGSMNTYGAPNDGYNANLYFGVVPAFSM